MEVSEAGTEHLLDHTYSAFSAGSIEGCNGVPSAVSVQCASLADIDQNTDTYETALLNLLRYHTSFLEQKAIETAIDRAMISPNALDALSIQQIQTLVTSNAVNYDVIQQLQRQKTPSVDPGPLQCTASPENPHTQQQPPQQQPIQQPTEQQTEQQQQQLMQQQLPMQQQPAEAMQQLALQPEPKEPGQDDKEATSEGINIMGEFSLDHPIGIDEEQLLEIQKHVKELILSQQANLPKGLTSNQQQQLVEKLLLRQIQQLQLQQQLEQQNISSGAAALQLLDGQAHNIPPLHAQEGGHRQPSISESPLISPKVITTLATNIRNATTTLTTGKHTRKRKDSKKPPMTPYNLFIHEISGAVKQEFPNAVFSELPKIYSSKWNSLPLKERQEYADRHRLMLEEYRALPELQPVAANSSPPATSTTQSNLLLSPFTCVNEDCQNPAVPSDDRGTSYCSNDCVVQHCRKVFDHWVEKRLQTVH